MSPQLTNNKKKIIIYYPKFNTTKLVIYNFPSLTSKLSITNVDYQFKCLLRDSFANKVIT